MRREFLHSLFLLLTPGVALAGGISQNFELRVGLTAGAWDGQFQQSGQGTTTTLTSSQTSGMGFSLGFSGAAKVPLFLDWTLTSFSAKSGTGKPGEASYLATGLTAGFSSHDFPLEFYVGAESGSYTFATGTSDDFTTTGYLAGIDWVFRPQPYLWWGIKGEYRWLKSTHDSGGDISSDYSTTITVPYVGLYVQAIL